MWSEYNEYKKNFYLQWLNIYRRGTANYNGESLHVIIDVQGALDVIIVGDVFFLGARLFQ